MHNDLKSKTMMGIIWSFIDLFFNQAGNLIIQIILARLLLPEDFGIIGLVVAFVSLAQTFIDSGFTNALIREADTSQEDYSTVFYYNLGISLVIYFILFAIAPSISNFYNEEKLTSIVRVLSISTIITSLGAIQRTILIKKLDFKSQAIANTVSVVFSGIVSIYYAYKGLGVWSLVIFNVFKNVLLTIILSLENKWLPSLVFSIESFKKYFTFGWKLMISMLIDSLSANINSLVIGKMYSKVELGYYSNVSKIFNAIQTTLYGVVGKVSYPVLGKLQSEPDILKAGYRKIIKFISFINFPIMIGLIIIAKPLILVLLGDKWADSIIYFQLLSVTGILYPLQAINLNILQVKGRTDLFLKVTIIKRIIGFTSIFFIIVLKLDMITLLGIGIIDSFISFFINSYYSGKLLNYTMKNQIKDISILFVMALLMGIIILPIQYIVVKNNLILVISIFLGIISYIILCIVFRVETFYESKKMVLNIVHNRLKVEKQ